MKRNRLKGGIRAAPVAAAALAALAIAPQGSPARSPAPSGPSEAAVKAGFLIKFPAYVAWPAAARPKPGAPLEICILGADPFGPLIDNAARGQQVDGHPLHVRRPAAAGFAHGCHVAFLQGDSPELLKGLQGRPVLTVTDSRAGTRRGMIHFVSHEGRVRFDIDEAQAARSGVGISSRLLGIALNVRRP